MQPIRRAMRFIERAATRDPVVTNRIARLASLDRHELQIVAGAFAAGSRVDWTIRHAGGVMATRGLESALALMPILDRPGHPSELVSSAIVDTPQGRMLRDPVVHEV